MALTNEDLDVIRKIVDDRAAQTERLISMQFAQLRFRLTGPHNNIQQNNPWGNQNGQGFGWPAPNPSMQATLNNNNNFGTTFGQLASVENLKESDFPKDFGDGFDKAFGSIIKFTDFIKLSVAERTEIMSSKLDPFIMSKVKEQMEKAGLTMPPSPDLFGGKDLFGGDGNIGIF